MNWQYCFLGSPPNQSEEQHMERATEFSRFFESTKAAGNPALTSEEVLWVRGTESFALFERKLFRPVHSLN